MGLFWLCPVLPALDSPCKPQLRVSLRTFWPFPGANTQGFPHRVDLFTLLREKTSTSQLGREQPQGCSTCAGVIMSPTPPSACSDSGFVQDPALIFTTKPIFVFSFNLRDSSSTWVLYYLECNFFFFNLAFWITKCGKANQPHHAALHPCGNTQRARRQKCNE